MCLGGFRIQQGKAVRPPGSPGYRKTVSPSANIWFGWGTNRDSKRMCRLCNGRVTRSGRPSRLTDGNPFAMFPPDLPGTCLHLAEAALAT